MRVVRSRQRTGFRRRAYLVPRDVIGVPGLRLKLEEDRDPLVLVGEMKEKTTVLPDAVIFDERLDVALVHVDVVDSVAGLEPKVLVLLALWPPALSKGVNQSLLVCHRTLDVV